jgi:membrane protein YqaA with SNARE-associated domain
VPFSADVLLVGLLIAGVEPWSAIVVATLGNWLGGLTSYGIGRMGDWRWIERLGVNRETLEKQQSRISRFGAPIALLSWVPIIGDVFAVALGFYRVKFVPSSIYMLIGKGGRFVCWYLIWLWSLGS